MLISYSTNKGPAINVILYASGVGVTIAARIKIKTIAYLRFFDKVFELISPALPSKKATKGISKKNPEPAL